MNTYIFSKQTSEIVLDLPEPVEVDFRFIHQRKEYENRPRYSVSKELSDSWEDGRKVMEGKDFELEYDKSYGLIFDTTPTKTAIIITSNHIFNKKK